MPRQIKKGDAVKLSGKVARRWDNGQVTVHLRGLDYPVTLHESDIDEIIPQLPEPRPRNRRKPLYDKPT
ncbi:hypothetical protein [Sinorhizobium sp. BJ1]|uniref:hypothetical protein n=1 Tax=Sinorhizobium sp. BJ1 TaxID=2035455 RepID=UPI000BEAC02F|nr:hypothetical protein [Sinorhizobium sp. BJ1]PDT80589.1 hypothetical protein CO676_26675 [Sinorhizobium sp. BJ1]